MRRVGIAPTMCLLLVSGWALAKAPTVVEASPDNGETGVDPSLRKIKVTFDQDMSRRSYSWVGGGPKFPKTRGKPRWLNARTCLLPVRLEPSHEYWLSVNGGRFKGFRSRKGEAAVPNPS